MAVEAGYTTRVLELLLCSNGPKERWHALEFCFSEWLARIVLAALRYIGKPRIVTLPFIIQDNYGKL